MHCSAAMVVMSLVHDARYTMASRSSGFSLPSIVVRTPKLLVNSKLPGNLLVRYLDRSNSLDP